MQFDFKNTKVRYFDNLKSCYISTNVTNKNLHQLPFESENQKKMIINVLKIKTRVKDKVECR